MPFGNFAANSIHVGKINELVFHMHMNLDSVGSTVTTSILSPSNQRGLNSFKTDSTFTVLHDKSVQNHMRFQ